MQKPQIEKGFTLLEVVVALLLFSLLMGSLWQFFGETYKLYINFDYRAELNEQARIASSFIREEIRLSDQITLTVTTPEGEKKFHPPENPATTESSSAFEGELKEITIKTLDNTAGEKGLRAIKLQKTVSPGKEQGEYRLIYESKGIQSLISDKVEKVTVSRTKDSSILQFECILAVTGRSGVNQKVKTTFSESIEYKSKYPTS